MLVYSCPPSPSRAGTYLTKILVRRVSGPDAPNLVKLHLPRRPLFNVWLELHLVMVSILDSHCISLFHATCLRTAYNTTCRFVLHETMCVVTKVCCKHVSCDKVVPSKIKLLSSNRRLKCVSLDTSCSPDIVVLASLPCLFPSPGRSPSSTDMCFFFSLVVMHGGFPK